MIVRFYRMHAESDSIAHVTAEVQRPRSRHDVVEQISRSYGRAERAQRADLKWQQEYRTRDTRRRGQTAITKAAARATASLQPAPSTRPQ
jgi:hypothetical protein